MEPNSYPLEVTPPPMPIKKSKRKLILIIISALVVVIVGVGAYLLFFKSKPVAQQTNSSNTKVTTVKDTHPNRIRLLATGDFIAHDSVNTAALQTDGSYNYLPMMKDFLPLMKAADIRFCNDPILNGGAPYGITGYPTFNSPTAFVTDMGKLGCNLVNTASNHSFDKTQAAITASVDAWSTVPDMLAVAGENRTQAEHDTIHYFTVKGVKFAFLAYTTYSNNDAPAQNDFGVNIFSQTFATTQIATAKANGAQVIIASMRWGTEYSMSVNAEQKADAQFLTDQGVNLILGHGSHELQPVQELTGVNGNKTTVWYSLGNFINTQEPAETLFNGLAVIDFDTKTLQITTMSYLPLYMHYQWTAAQAAADAIFTRNNLHMYLLENTTQPMIDAQQLHTTVAIQTARITTTLNTYLAIPLVTSAQYYAQ